MKSFLRVAAALVAVVLSFSYSAEAGHRVVTKKVTRSPRARVVHTSSTTYALVPAKAATSYSAEYSIRLRRD